MGININSNLGLKNAHFLHIISIALYLNKILIK